MLNLLHNTCRDISLCTVYRNRLKRLKIVIKRQRSSDMSLIQTYKYVFMFPKYMKTFILELNNEIIDAYLCYLHKKYFLKYLLLSFIYLVVFGLYFFIVIYN